MTSLKRLLYTARALLDYYIAIMQARTHAHNNDWVMVGYPDG